MRWAPSRAIIVTAMMVIALGCVVAGIAQIYPPAGWIAAGIGIAYLALAADGEEGTRGRAQGR